MKLTHASVFSGIGGPEVAATMLGWENLFHCEINPFGRAVLDYWYPNAKSYEDITTTDFSEWCGKVTVLTGGFPCQPFSYAGQRRGATDDRYLWPYMFRCIDQVQPDWVVAENVAGILTMVEQGKVSQMETQTSLFDEDNGVQRYRLRETFTLERICTDLEGHGYEVQPVLIPACAVGAPHRRDRVFIVGRRIAADTYDRPDGRNPGEDEGKGGKERLQKRDEIRQPDESGEVRPKGAEPFASHATGSGEGTPRTGDCTESCGSGPDKQPSEWGTASEWSDRFYSILRHAADTRGIDVERPDNHGIDCENGRPSSNEATKIHSAEDTRPREFPNRWEQFPSVSPVHRGNDGLPFNVDDLTISAGKWRTEALKAYGNAIVPQVMYEIFRAIEMTYQNQ